MESETHFGNYRILRKVGAGGMADVYEAVRVGLDNFQTRVALKCILPSLTRDHRFVKMFIREAHLGSQLQHPNIIQIQDFNKVNDTYYIAMEFVDGVDLSRIIKRLRAKGISLPASVVVEVGLAVLAGLGYAHQARRADGTPLKIIHRDVKPSNILITPAGSVKIGDFGIAKATDTTTGHSLTGDQIKGTIHYMSPEQIDGVPLTPASDLFSLGTILYEMLTFRPLFIGPTMSAVLLKIVMVNIEPDMQIIVNNYPEFEGFLRKALAADPADRFGKASEMGEALHAIAAEIGGGMSLKQFLAIHPELFEPFGTQPGDTVDDADMLSIVRSPQSLADSSVEVAVPAYSETSHTTPEFEFEQSNEGVVIVDPDEEVEAIEDDAETEEEEGSFYYYPPDSDEEPDSASGASETSVGDDSDDEPVLADIAQDLLDVPTGETEVDVEAAAAAEEQPDGPVSLLHPDADGAGGDQSEGLNDDGLDDASDDAETDDSPFVVLDTDGALPPPGALDDEAIRDSVDEISPDDGVEPRSRPFWRRLIFLLGGGLLGLLLFLMYEASNQPDTSRPRTPNGEVATREASSVADLTPPARPAQLHIDSTPRGARITLGSKTRAAALTPSTLPLPPDTRQITVRLELAGYQPFEQTISYQPGQELSLAPTLVPVVKDGRLTVTSKPSGAKILLNGKATGHRTPYTFTGLDVGRTYRVELVLGGHLRWQRTIDFKEGQDAQVSAVLKARSPSPAQPRAQKSTKKAVVKPVVTGKGTLVLNTVPPDAVVKVDGVARGHVPVTLEVPAGKHKVVFTTIEDNQTKTTVVDVEAGRTRRVVWDAIHDRWLGP